MSKIIECVPNFSEGRNSKIIDAIVESIRSTTGVTVLDVDPGVSTNRTVITFVGDPFSIVEGAMAAAKTAFSLIDMTSHKGEHPRIGALDVCPFIPISGVTIEECVLVSKIFGERLASELGVPVYLYSFSANQELDYRTTMPQIRSGEYEGLEEKLQLSKWKPDFGPNVFISSWGATVTGARKLLIAYNINIVSTKEQAHKIALNLRERGRGPSQPGRLKCVQGLGWSLKEFNISQISLNLTDIDITPMHIAFEEASRDAKEYKLPIIGSEIIGMIPKAALLDAAHYYMEKENLFILDESQKFAFVINRLGLSTLSPFNPKERIIEYCLPLEKTLMELSLKDFVSSVGDRSPAPGGGSVSALLASLGTALGSMMGKLSYGKRIWEPLEDKMRNCIPILHSTSQELLNLVHEDTEAFSDYMIACKLPKGTKEEILRRDKALVTGLKKAIEVPMSMTNKANAMWPIFKILAEFGNINCISDLQVGAKCLETSVIGGYYNVMINLKDIQDEDFKKETQDRIKEARDTATQKSKEIEDIILKRL